MINTNESICRFLEQYDKEKGLFRRIFWDSRFIRGLRKAYKKDTNKDGNWLNQFMNSFSDKRRPRSGLSLRIYEDLLKVQKKKVIIETNPVAHFLNSKGLCSLDNDQIIELCLNYSGDKSMLSKALEAIAIYSRRFLSSIEDAKKWIEIFNGHRNPDHLSKVVVILGESDVLGTILYNDKLRNRLISNSFSKFCSVIIMINQNENLLKQIDYVSLFKQADGLLDILNILEKNKLLEDISWNQVIFPKIVRAQKEDLLTFVSFGCLLVSLKKLDETGCLNSTTLSHAANTYLKDMQFDTSSIIQVLNKKISDKKQRDIFYPIFHLVPRADAQIVNKGFTSLLNRFLSIPK